MKLTVRQIDTAKPKEKPYKLSDGGGLYLEVTTSGSRYWRLKYRYAGKEKRLAFAFTLRFLSLKHVKSVKRRRSYYLLEVILGR